MHTWALNCNAEDILPLLLQVHGIATHICLSHDAIVFVSHGCDVASQFPVFAGIAGCDWATGCSQAAASCAAERAAARPNCAWPARACAVQRDAACAPFVRRDAGASPLRRQGSPCRRLMQPRAHRAVCLCQCPVFASATALPALRQSCCGP